MAIVLAARADEDAIQGQIFFGASVILKLPYEWIYHLTRQSP